MNNPGIGLYRINCLLHIHVLPCMFSQLASARSYLHVAIINHMLRLQNNKPRPHVSGDFVDLLLYSSRSRCGSCRHFLSAILAMAFSEVGQDIELDFWCILDSPLYLVCVVPFGLSHTFP